MSAVCCERLACYCTSGPAGFARSVCEGSVSMIIASRLNKVFFFPLRGREGSALNWVFISQFLGIGAVCD